MRACIPSARLRTSVHTPAYTVRSGGAVRWEQRNEDILGARRLGRGERTGRNGSLVRCSVSGATHICLRTKSKRATVYFEDTTASFSMEKGESLALQGQFEVTVEVIREYAVCNVQDGNLCYQAINDASY
jgi:hypothetical protein